MVHHVGGEICAVHENVPAVKIAGNLHDVIDCQFALHWDRLHDDL